MELTNDNLQDLIPEYFTQGQAILDQMVVYARIYHPSLPLVFYPLEFDPIYEIILSFCVDRDDPSYKVFSEDYLSDFINAFDKHFISYMADDDFKPARLVELFPDYVLPFTDKDLLR